MIELVTPVISGDLAHCGPSEKLSRMYFGTIQREGAWEYLLLVSTSLAQGLF